MARHLGTPEDTWRAVSERMSRGEFEFLVNRFKVRYMTADMAADILYKSKEIIG